MKIKIEKVEKGVWVVKENGVNHIYLGRTAAKDAKAHYKELTRS